MAPWPEAYDCDAICNDLKQRGVRTVIRTEPLAQFERGTYTRLAAVFIPWHFIVWSFLKARLQLIQGATSAEF